MMTRLTQALQAWEAIVPFRLPRLVQASYPDSAKSMAPDFRRERGSLVFGDRTCQLG